MEPAVPLQGYEDVTEGTLYVEGKSRYQEKWEETRRRNAVKQLTKVSDTTETHCRKK
jgi:hypothetical protein